MTQDIKDVLKLALEALNEYVNVVVSVNDPNEWTPKVADAGEPARKAITAIKEALAQHDSVQAKPEPEQEPVANYCKECLTYNGHHEGCSHYTTPPQRTWVGLADDEYFGLQMKIKTPMISVQDYIDAMRMVEAKLKERNT